MATPFGATNTIIGRFNDSVTCNLNRQFGDIGTAMSSLTTGVPTPFHGTTSAIIGKFDDINGCLNNVNSTTGTIFNGLTPVTRKTTGNMDGTFLATFRNVTDGTSDTVKTINGTLGNINGTIGNVTAKTIAINVTNVNATLATKFDQLGTVSATSTGLQNLNGSTGDISTVVTGTATDIGNADFKLNRTTAITTSTITTNVGPNRRLRAVLGNITGMTTTANKAVRRANSIFGGITTANGTCASGVGRLSSQKLPV